MNLKRKPNAKILPSSLAPGGEDPTRGTQLGSAPQEIPTVTTLLRRKRAQSGSTQSATTPVPPLGASDDPSDLAPPPFKEVTGSIMISQEPVESEVMSSGLMLDIPSEPSETETTVRRAGRSRGSSAASPLVLLDPKQLRASSTPWQKGLAQVFQTMGPHATTLTAAWFDAKHCGFGLHSLFCMNPMRRSFLSGISLQKALRGNPAFTAKLSQEGVVAASRESPLRGILGVEERESLFLVWVGASTSGGAPALESAVGILAIICNDAASRACLPCLLKAASYFKTPPARP